MKVGSAGSIPDGVKSDMKIHLQPLHYLLRDIGKAGFELNTAIVGLDAVENGYKKPKSLNISWAPSDQKDAARASRRFVLGSVLIRVSEVLYQFVSAISKLPKFEEVRKKWDSNTSAAEKVAMISTVLLDETDYLIPGVVLLIHWRNRIVHPNSNAQLSHQHKQILLMNEDQILREYRNLDVSRLVGDFETQRPTLKDVSCLIAMTINFARKIDRTMQTNLNRDELDAWLDHYELVPILNKVKAETSPKNYKASICRLFRSRAPYLLEPYLEHYHS